jgi:hypothetical protein
MAENLKEKAREFIKNNIGLSLVEQHRILFAQLLPSRIDFINRGFDYQIAELAMIRNRLAEKARTGNVRAKVEVEKVKVRQRSLQALKETKLTELKRELDMITIGSVDFLAHALVIPADKPEEQKRYNAQVEEVAMRVATVYEESLGAKVKDVHKPELARLAGLSDWPGFDLLSIRSANTILAIEVKGRADTGEVELSENEWAKAINLRDKYWLYVVYNCASHNPKLLRIQDPFGKLLFRQKGSYVIDKNSILEAAETD